MRREEVGPEERAGEARRHGGGQEQDTTVVDESEMHRVMSCPSNRCTVPAWTLQIRVVRGGYAGNCPEGMRYNSSMYVVYVHEFSIYALIGVSPLPS